MNLVAVALLVCTHLFLWKENILGLLLIKQLFINSICCLLTGFSMLQKKDENSSSG